MKQSKRKHENQKGKTLGQPRKGGRLQSKLSRENEDVIRHWMKYEEDYSTLIPDVMKLCNLKSTITARKYINELQD